jgi:hypothetical protein
MRPEVVSGSGLLVVIQGTCQVGWVTKECVPDELAVEAAPTPRVPPADMLDSVVAATLAGRATENENTSRREPAAPDAAPAAADRKLAVTETRSPATNGRRGENAVPRPSGCALNRPTCTPLRDPTTRTDATSPGKTAGKSTLVPGAASGVPGNGNTSNPREDEWGALLEESAAAGAKAPLPRTAPAAPATTEAQATARMRERGARPKPDLETPNTL